MCSGKRLVGLKDFWSGRRYDLIVLNERNASFGMMLTSIGSRRYFLVQFLNDESLKSRA